MEPTIYRAVRPIPRLGIHAGDRVIFDPEADAITALWRPILNTGAVLLATVTGALEMVTPPPSPSERQVVGLPPAPPASRHVEVSPRAARLTLVR